MGDDMKDTPIQTADSSLRLPGEPPAARPWEDLAAVLRNAEQARAANENARAYTFYARATELDPNNAQAWIGRAGTAPDVDDAITSWGYALALKPDDEQGRGEIARRIAERSDAATADQVPALVALGRRLAEAGHKQFAYPLLKRATDLDDRNEEAWLWRAGLTDNRREMITSLNQVLALNPDNPRARSGLDWAQALDPGAAHQPPDAESEAAHLIDLAQQQLKAGNKPHAHELFVQATDLNPRSEQAWLWRGGTTSNIDEALTCMEQALAVNPDNDSAREARSWLRVKKLREGAKALSDAPVPATTVAEPVKPPQKVTKRSGLRLPVLLILLVLAVIFLLVALAIRVGILA